MTLPPAAENTPEKFDKFMREEIARQGELAEHVGAEARKRAKETMLKRSHATLASLSLPMSSLNSLTALPPRMSRLAFSLRNGRS